MKAFIGRRKVRTIGVTFTCHTPSSDLHGDPRCIGVLATLTRSPQIETDPVTQNLSYIVQQAGSLLTVNNERIHTPVIVEIACSQTSPNERGKSGQMSASRDTQEFDGEVCCIGGPNIFSGKIGSSALLVKAGQLS